MSQLIDALQEVATIAHWTVVPHSGASGPELAFPPFIAWRYVGPSSELAECLLRAVSSYRGAVAWELSTMGQRWTLMPARIREYAESHGCDGGLVAAAQLKIEDPEFGKRANADLHLLAEHIRNSTVSVTSAD
jgi:hypothetical protein